MSTKIIKKHKRIAIFCFVAIFLILFFYPLRSYLIMSAYSYYNNKDSVMSEKGFKIDMSGGLLTLKKDWYPFVNIYDTSYEFSKYTGKDLSLTVLYNFGAFKGNSSLLYDENSKYFAAFYGAYAVCVNDSLQKRYGFDGTKVNIDEISAVPMFDYKYLVIEDMGCENPEFELISHTMSDKISYVGYDDWVRIDAKMRSNSPTHERMEFKLGYIQYGKPVKSDKGDFFETELWGRMYVRYFEEYESTIVLYVMGADKEVIDECDKEILTNTEIKNME